MGHETTTAAPATDPAGDIEIIPGKRDRTQEKAEIATVLSKALEHAVEIESEKELMRILRPAYDACKVFAPELSADGAVALLTALAPFARKSGNSIEFAIPNVKKDAGCAGNAIRTLIEKITTRKRDEVSVTILDSYKALTALRLSLESMEAER
jgi:hypothetical protein